MIKGGIFSKVFLVFLLVFSSTTMVWSADWVLPPQEISLTLLGNVSPWTNNSVAIIPKPGFPTDVDIDTGSYIGDNVLPNSNNTGSVGLLQRRWAEGFFEKLNVSELGGFSAILLSADIVSNRTINATAFIGDGSQLTGIEFNATSGTSVFGNVSILGTTLAQNITAENITLNGFISGDGSQLTNLPISGSPWSTSNDVIFNDSQSLKVGINTSNPLSTLHVIGDVNVTGNVFIGNGTIKINTSGITFTDDTFQNTAFQPVVAAGWNGSTDDKVILINDSALVGIQTRFPRFALDVNGTIRALQFNGSGINLSGVCLTSGANCPSGIVDTSKQGGQPGLFNDSTTIFLNLTFLNDTIDIKLSEIDFNDTSKTGAGPFLFNDSVFIFFNDTLLNETILLLDTNETIRMNNLLSRNCSMTESVVGFFNNGSVLCGSRSDGDWINNGTRLYNFTEDTRVGIGKIEPAATLDVVNSSRISFDGSNHTFMHESIHTLSVPNAFTTVLTITPSTAVGLETSGFVHVQIFGDDTACDPGGTDTMWWFSYSGGALDKTEEVLKNDVGGSPSFQLNQVGNNIELQVQSCSVTYTGTLMATIWAGGGNGASGDTVLYTIS